MCGYFNVLPRGFDLYAQNNGITTNNHSGGSIFIVYYILYVFKYVYKSGLKKNVFELSGRGSGSGRIIIR